MISTEDPVALATAAAIHTGDVAKLKQLLDQHPWLANERFGTDGPSGMSRTLLHVATDWPGHFPNIGDSVRAIVAAGADVSARFAGPHEETPLHWAASSNDIEALDALLDAGADIDAQGAVIAGGPPLADATAFAQWDAAFRLVERGAQTNLFAAAALGLMNQVNPYFDSSQRVSQEEVNEALWAACHGGHLEAARYFVGQGAQVDWLPPWEPLTPLDAATRSEAQNVVTWLHSCGAKTAAQLCND